MTPIATRMSIPAMIADQGTSTGGDETTGVGSATGSAEGVAEGLPSLAFFAFSNVEKYIGIAAASITPSIHITTTNSMRVNPRLVRDITSPF